VGIRNTALLLLTTSAILLFIPAGALERDSTALSPAKICSSLQKSVMSGLESRSWRFDRGKTERIPWVELSEVDASRNAELVEKQARAKLQARLFVDALGKPSGCLRGAPTSAIPQPVRLSLEIAPSGRITNVRTVETGERAELAGCFRHYLRRMPSAQTAYVVRLEFRVFDFPCVLEPTPTGAKKDVRVKPRISPRVPLTWRERREIDYMREWSGNTLAAGYRPYDVSYQWLADTSEATAFLVVMVTDVADGLVCREVRLFIDGVEMAHAAETEVWGGGFQFLSASFLAHSFPENESPRAAHVFACGQRVELAMAPFREMLEQLQKLRNRNLNPNLK
jgi:hypothetical protein